MNTVIQITAGAFSSVVVWFAFTYLVQPAIERRAAAQQEKRRAKYRWIYGHDPEINPESAASARIGGIVFALFTVVMLVSAVSLERWFLASAVTAISLLQTLLLIRKARTDD